ncbi:helix-turn-helix domain-containing protein [Denitrobaculum tricleocarpae]|uniref:Uncharacterized protein n=1 Tax=Denitrobaculum tricleocarpae TaxID=2591009 RepID=A0A545TXF2_9PROT|nr:helix-turn-helix domain-containing protein [Denitrobaculum tricleocarpae]TQV81903.1 hypothetical protein FKG95_06605 [Denitrobaculum tricleocarpae]
MTDSERRDILTRVNVKRLRTGKISLVLEFEAEDLASLLGDLGLLTDTSQSRKAYNQARTEADRRERLRAARELGPKLEEQAQELQRCGMLRTFALAQVADTHGLSVDDVRTYLRLHRIQSRKNREQAVVDAVERGLSYRQISDEMCVSRSTVGNIARRAGIKPKAPINKKRKLGGRGR